MTDNIEAEITIAGNKGDMTINVRPDRWRVTFEDGAQHTLYSVDGIAAETAVALCWPGRKFTRLEPAGDFNYSTGIWERDAD